MVRHQSEKRGKCLGIATGAGTRQLQNGLGYAPQAQAGDGTPWSGAIGHKHLDYYLDEFTFRFNRRKSASRGKLFYRLTQQAVQVKPAPFDSLIKPQSLGGG